MASSYGYAGIVGAAMIGSGGGGARDSRDSDDENLKGSGPPSPEEEDEEDEEDDEEDEEQDEAQDEEEEEALRQMVEEEEKRRQQREQEERLRLRILERERKRLADLMEAEKKLRDKEVERLRRIKMEELERRRQTAIAPGEAEDEGSPEVVESDHDRRHELVLPPRTRQEEENREIRVRERKREERGGVNLEEWLLREWGGYDIASTKQQDQHPRYEPPKRLCSDLARLASHVSPRELFNSGADRGFDQLATLLDGISSLAKKAEGHGELARDLRRESVQTQQLNDVMFKDKQLLQTGTSLFEQLDPLGQQVIAAAAETSMDAIAGAVAQRGDNPKSQALAEALKKALAGAADGNQSVKGYLREYLLAMPAFNRPEVLARFANLRGGPAAELGLDRDAKLRARNAKQRPDLFRKDDSGSLLPANQGCSVCDDDESGLEVRSGKVDESLNDDFLSFPGRINKKSVKALIDTGGGCNLIDAKLVARWKLKPDPDKKETLVMADGKPSKDCDIVTVRWRFDDRDTVWTNVEFVVVENSHFGALLGLPFLRLSETIHTKGGRLVFPEFKGVHTNKKGIPLYHFRKLKAGR